MDFIKKAVNSSLFKAILCALIGFILLIEKLPIYAGIALGISIREFLLAFKDAEDGKL